MTVQENFKSNRVTLGAIQRAVRTRSSLGKRKEREKREDGRKDSGRRYEKKIEWRKSEQEAVVGSES